MELSSVPWRESSEAAANILVDRKILKLMTGSDLQLTPYHFRDQRMHELDIVSDRYDRIIVGIEVKALSATRSGPTCFACGAAQTSPRGPTARANGGHKSYVH